MICAAAAPYTSDPLIFSPLVSLSLATIILVAIWSVFGPASYLKRLFWSHLIGIIVAIGPGIGYLFFLVVFAKSGFDDTELAFGFAFALVAIPPLSLAAQLPFWFFRVFFGWQFVFGDQPTRQSYTLRDIFSVTFLFALCFAVPQMAVNLQKSLNDNFDPKVEFVEVVQPDGSTVFERQERTDEQAIADAQRTHDSEIRLGILMGFAGAAVYLFLITLIAFPVLLFVFLLKEVPHGCFATVVYGLGLLCCCLLLIGAFSGFSGLGEGMLFFGLPIACFGGALAIPLAVSRVIGFRLTSLKRYAKEQAKLELENTPEISAAAAD